MLILQCDSKRRHHHLLRCMSVPALVPLWFLESLLCALLLLVQQLAVRGLSSTRRHASLATASRIVVQLPFLLASRDGSGFEGIGRPRHEHASTVSK